MDTRQVIARFEAERQALALMDHPNIARVIDAGAAESGRPYFVMELVRGIPVTEFCDRNQLNTMERLRLFLPVGQAVQHAHQAIVAPGAWAISTGDPDIVIAVIDSGINYLHEDLSANMWRNPGESGIDDQGNDKATNGLDDDANGFVDEVFGIDPGNQDSW
jgi:serine/threonine protein kinase